MTWITALDIIGTLVFAISGIITAINNRFDLVGSAVIGLVTAVGGGTLRDLLIGQTPVSWMLDDTYLVVIGIAMVLTYTLKEKVLKLRRGLFLFDTIGIALFTILGIEKSLGAGLSPSISILMGIVSAVFGGVIRDVLTNIVPLIFREEIYATACLAGGLSYLALQQLPIPDYASMLVAMAVVLCIRYLAVKHHWSLRFSCIQSPSDGRIM